VPGSAELPISSVFVRIPSSTGVSRGEHATSRHPAMAISRAAMNRRMRAKETCPDAFAKRRRRLGFFAREHLFFAFAAELAGVEAVVVAALFEQLFVGAVFITEGDIVKFDGFDFLGQSVCCGLGVRRWEIGVRGPLGGDAGEDGGVSLIFGSVESNSITRSPAACPACISVSKRAISLMGLKNIPERLIRATRVPG